MSTATPRRCSRYARSPPILTADAAGIGSSISPRRRRELRSSSSAGGGSCRSTILPLRIARRGPRVQVDVREVALVQTDEALRQLSCPSGQQHEQSCGERIERSRMPGLRAGPPPHLGDDRERRAPAGLSTRMIAVGLEARGGIAPGAGTSRARTPAGRTR